MYDTLLQVCCGGNTADADTVDTAADKQPLLNDKTKAQIANKRAGTAEFCCVYSSCVDYGNPIVLSDQQQQQTKQRSLKNPSPAGGDSKNKKKPEKGKRVDAHKKDSSKKKKPRTLVQKRAATGRSNNKRNNSSKSKSATITTTTIRAHQEGGKTVTNDGLWLTRKQFGHKICPHGGNSIAVYKGYIFVTYYKGGMNDRHVCVARKKVDEGSNTYAWKTIQFPHRHVMFRGDKDKPEDERKGDSHNFIAIGICPKDDSIHLLYDLHAYTPADFKDDYFNYNITAKKGAATVSDDQWNLDLFLPKQTYLNESYAEKNPRAYYQATYPSFRVLDNNNSLAASWRFGGTVNATMRFSTYNGKEWGQSWDWNSAVPVHKRTGFYGSFQVYNKKLYACWSRRSNADKKNGIPQDAGLYFAYCNDTTGKGSWYTADGKDKFKLPLESLDPFLIAEPAGPGDKMAHNGFVVTPSGGVIIKLQRNGMHLQYVRPHEKATEFKVIEDTPPGGSMYVRTAGSNNRLFLGGGNQKNATPAEILMVGLNTSQQPSIWSTRIEKTTHSATASGDDIYKEEYSVEWKLLYTLNHGPRYSHGKSIMKDDSIFYYLMQNKPSNYDSRPLHVWRFDLPPFAS